MLKYYIYNCCSTERMLMSITLVALKIWPPFPTFSLSSDNLCFKQVEERASLFTSSLIPINFLKMLAQHLRRHQVSRKIRRNKMNTGSRDSTNPRLIVQFRELRIDVHQMSIHPVKISVFIKPLKIKESSGGRSKMPEGRCVVVGGLSLCLCQVELSHCPVLWVVMAPSQLEHGSGQHLESGHHSSPGQASNEQKICLRPGASCSKERGRELYNVQGQVTSHGERWHIVKTYVDRLRFHMISSNDWCIVSSDVTSWACLHVTTPDFFSISCF